MNKDYYRVLGLADNAEDVVIRAAFRWLAHCYHPDKQLDNKEQANRMMADINEAYGTLSDPLLKSAYDRKKRAYLLALGSEYYLALGLSDSADAQLIHAAYRALSRKLQNLAGHHLSERKIIEKRLIEINLAYQVLTDPVRRKAYDRQQQYLVRTQKGQGFGLWKMYLVYSLFFYILVAAIITLVWLGHDFTKLPYLGSLSNTVLSLLKLRSW
jgi:DnaJ-class molecular chaperone